MQMTMFSSHLPVLSARHPGETTAAVGIFDLLTDEWRHLGMVGVRDLVATHRNTFILFLFLFSLYLTRLVPLRSQISFTRPGQEWQQHSVT